MLNKINRQIEPKTDEQIVEELKKNKEAFVILYERYKDKIYSYIGNTIYDPHSAEEITSEVFIKVYEYCREKKIDNFKAFIYKIAHNNIVNWLRKQKDMLDTSHLELEVDNTDKEIKHDIHKAYTQRIVQDIMKRLDIRNRELLYMYYMEGLDYNQIAEQFGTTKNSIGVWITRAKKQFKQIAETYNLKEILF